MLKLLKKYGRIFSIQSNSGSGTGDPAPLIEVEADLDATQKKIKDAADKADELLKNGDAIDNMPPGHEKDTARTAFLKRLKDYNDNIVPKVKEAYYQVMKNAKGGSDMARYMALIEAGMAAWKEGGQLGMPFRRAASYGKAVIDKGVQKACSSVNNDWKDTVGFKPPAILMPIIAPIHLALKPAEMVAKKVGSVGGVVAGAVAAPTEVLIAGAFAVGAGLHGAGTLLTTGNIEKSVKAVGSWQPSIADALYAAADSCTLVKNSVKFGVEPAWDATADAVAKVTNGVAKGTYNIAEKAYNAVTGQEHSKNAPSPITQEDAEDQNMQQPGMASRI